MLPVNGDYLNLSSSDGLSRQSYRENFRSDLLRDPEGGMRPPGEVTPEPPKLRTERSWSPLPSVPPNSPISHEDLETEENTPGRTPSPSPPRSTSPPQPEPELLRPTTPSYTPDVSLNSSGPSPGVAPQACSSPVRSPTPYPGEPEEVDSFAEDETVSWHEPDSPERSPSPSQA
ncbi:hypothetical protein PUN28_002135 [Cardiocondyla obscurior]|uniref:Uncharacterized protein n=1 Tax=Cardiocondyla obscurior TaxID=286306 RepID=A0AAW2GSQ5_9HYME